MSEDEEGLTLEYILLISIFSCVFAYPMMKMVPIVIRACIAFYRFMVRPRRLAAQPARPLLLPMPPPRPPLFFCFSWCCPWWQRCLRRVMRPKMLCEGHRRQCTLAPHRVLCGTRCSCAFFCPC